MHGGDSLFGRMSSQAHVYRDSGVDSELDHKAYKVTEKLSECINTIANEPSVAFYRIQEHVRKTLPQLVEQKHEVEEVQQLVQGACFDTEYAGNAVKGMQKSVVHFQNIQELLKNAMFMKQQIDYEEARKRQGKPAVVGANNGGRVEGGGSGSRVEEGSDTNMDDSAVSTDSSLVASAHMCSNSEMGSDVYTGNAEEQTAQADIQQEVVKETEDTALPEKPKDKLEDKDMVDTEVRHQETYALSTDEQQVKDTPTTDEQQVKDTPNTDIREQKNTQDIEDKEQSEPATTEDKELEDTSDINDNDQEDTPTNSGDDEQEDAQASDAKEQEQRVTTSVEDEKENNVEESRERGRNTAETEQPPTTASEEQAESIPDPLES